MYLVHPRVAGASGGHRHAVPQWGREDSEQDFAGASKKAATRFEACGKLGQILHE